MKKCLEDLIQADIVDEQEAISYLPPEIDV